ncbi:MAG: hypothetical protein KatS3mg051_1934 [Anaerolineae bacterium]|nr:MAG: hypothetical protein KatS3mg051_1934 [Anaerolineae bacterium]
MRLTGEQRYRFARDCVTLTGSWRTICAELMRRGWDESLCTEGRIKAARRDWKILRWQHENGVGQHAVPFGVSTYTYTALNDNGETLRLPVFDGEPKLEGDWVVCGDVHLPTTDYELAETMLRVARDLGLKRLLIAGDLINADAFSLYEHVVPPVSFEDEVRVAVRVVSAWCDWFDDILLLMGNHELRVIRRSNGNINATMLGHILNAGHGKLRVSPYSHAIITSGGQVWRVTHQRNYSRITGRLADQLAQKYQCNIISLHQHHVAVQRDTWNRYTVIDGGGLHDDHKMAYVSLVDNNMPTMARGFVLLVHGTGHLITPYVGMTDLDVLVTGLRMRRQPSAGVSSPV